VCVWLCVSAGYEDQQRQKAAAATKPKESKSKNKSKPKPAAPQGNGVLAPVPSSPLLGPAPVTYSAPAPMPEPVHPGPSPHEDRRRALQERLKRIEAQIRNLERLNKLRSEASWATPHRGPPGMSQHMHSARAPSAAPPHLQAAVLETPMPAGTKRRASDVSGSGGGGASLKKFKSTSGSAPKTTTLGGGGKLGSKAIAIMSSLMENPASKAYFNRPVDPIGDGSCIASAQMGIPLFSFWERSGAALKAATCHSGYSVLD